jgi:hypothetical protein
VLQEGATNILTGHGSFFFELQTAQNQNAKNLLAGIAGVIAV